MVVDILENNTVTINTGNRIVTGELKSVASDISGSLYCVGETRFYSEEIASVTYEDNLILHLDTGR